MSHITLASAVQSKTVQWLWPGWLPAGVLVVLDGDPGSGKSTLACDLAARLSRGEWAGRPVNSILVNGEDPPAEVTRPRLEAAGADLDRVALWAFDRPLVLPATPTGSRTRSGPTGRDSWSSTR